MLVSSDGSYIKRHVLLKNGETIYLEDKYKIKGIVLLKKPNLKKYDPTVGYKFELGDFLNESFVGQNTVFPDKYSAKQRKAIENELKELYEYQYKDHGYQLIDTSYLVFGDLTVLSVPVNDLVFFTEEMKGSTTVLQQSDFEKYRDDGMSQNIFDEYVDEDNFSAPVLSGNSSLSVNGADIENFYNSLKSLHIQALADYKESLHYKNKNIENITVKYDSKAKASEDESNLYPYMFVYSAWMKHSRYKLKIYEDFDVARLRLNEFTSQVLHPRVDLIYTFQLAYETQDGDIVQFEFSLHNGPDSDSSDLYDPKGKSYSCDIYESDEEDEEDEENQ